MDSVNDRQDVLEVEAAWNSDVPSGESGDADVSAHTEDTTN